MERKLRRTKRKLYAEKNHNPEYGFWFGPQGSDHPPMRLFISTGRFTKGGCPVYKSLETGLEGGIADEYFEPDPPASAG